MIQVAMNQGSLSAETTRLLGITQNPRALMLGMGRELGNLLKKWFRQKDQTDINKLAPDRREHFWLGISRAVQNPVLEGVKRVSVTINHPAIAQKVFGGTIFAKRAGALTIPVTEKAYGRTAKTFERETGLKLFLLKGPAAGKGASGLERAALAAIVGGKIEVEYILTPKVTQKADPTALPPEKDMTAALIKRGQAIVDREGNDK